MVQNSGKDTPRTTRRVLGEDKNMGGQEALHPASRQKLRQSLRRDPETQVTASRFERQTRDAWITHTSLPNQKLNKNDGIWPHDAHLLPKIIIVVLLLI